MITIENNPKITIDGEDVQTLKYLCKKAAQQIETFNPEHHGKTDYLDYKTKDFIERIIE